MEELLSCVQCHRVLAKRRLKEVVQEEGRARIRQMVCPNCLDQIMNESQRVRGGRHRESRGLAKALLTAGGRLHVVVPSADYASTFDTEEARARYAELLASSASSEELPYPSPTERLSWQQAAQ